MDQQIQKQYSRLGACDHHYTYQIRSDTGKHTTWMNLSPDQLKRFEHVVTGCGTPSSRWLGNEEDPHGDRYNCERADLIMGHLTDDELANGAFMNYDAPLNIEGIRAGTHSSPIAWMTAVKDRIRWLSRRLQEAEQKT